MRGEKMQEAEFRRRYVHRLSADGQRYRIAVQFKIRGSDAGGDGLLEAAQNSADAGRQFPCAERLGNVVVRAKVQATDLVFFGGFCRKENDGDFGQVFALAYPAADFKAATAGDHD